LPQLAEFAIVGFADNQGVDVVAAANVQGGGIFTFSSTDANTVNTTSGSAFSSTAATNGVRDAGQNIEAFINGLEATSQGRDIRVSSDFLDIELEIEEANAQSLSTFQALSITGGGANFQLSSSVDLNGKVSLGIQDVQTRQIGRFVDSNNATRFLDDLGSGSALNVVDGDLTDAQAVVGNAISEIASLRGRLGAFQQNTIGSTIRNLQIGVENVSAAESQIRDADFAAETAQLTRSQILVSAATNSLSLANSQPQNVLQLLG